MASTHINTGNVQQTVPFFWVSNMAASLSFYINGLGFEMNMKWEPAGSIEWCWLKKDNAAIMLQQYQPHLVPATTRGVGVSICFMCNDALTIYTDALARGLSPKEPFVGNNSWVVELTDPDGYNIMFESATDVKEGTKYTDWKKP